MTCTTEVITGINPDLNHLEHTGQLMAEEIWRGYQENFGLESSGEDITHMLIVVPRPQSAACPRTEDDAFILKIYPTTRTMEIYQRPVSLNGDEDLFMLATKAGTPQESPGIERVPRNAELAMSDVGLAIAKDGYQERPRPVPGLVLQKKDLSWEIIYQKDILGDQSGLLAFLTNVKYTLNHGNVLRNWLSFN